MRSALKFEFRVAVAVAPGTPGTGNVTTGWPFSHDKDVLPTLSTPSAKSVPGLAPSHQVSVVPAIAALGAPWGLAQIRISRSSSLAGIGMVLPFIPPISAPGKSSFQAYSPLTTSMLEYISPLARVQPY